MNGIYKLIIVDDEYAGRELIEKYVTDYCKDFEIAGIFKDGDEAISFLEKNDVELVITDIKMARVSGIELAKYIYENKPHINTVAVSAYSEFEYAKELMKYGALYYLLKFVDIDEFLEAMEIVRSNISQKKTVNQSQYDELQTEMFFYDLFENNFSSCEEAAKNYYEIEQNSDFKNSKCVRISVVIDEYEDFKKNRWKYTDEMFKNAILNVLRLLNPDLFVASMGEEGNELYFVAFNHGNSVIIDIKAVEREIEASFKIKAEVTVSDNVYLTDICLGNCFAEEKKSASASGNSDIYSEDLPAIVKSAVEIIEKNYRMPIVRSEIAEQIHINAIYLSKTFKKYTGRTLMTYLYEYRMKKAVELAQNGNTINEICEQIGYTDERAFRRAFKKYTGYSVRDYKKSSSVSVNKK